jgi:UDP-3-O-[3-hydroxymyristoyl] glucosamine N-acyltransferase
MALVASEIASRLQAELHGDATVTVQSVGPVDSARAGDIILAENEAYLERALQGEASVVLTSAKLTVPESCAKTLIRVANPRAAFARVLQMLFPPAPANPGVHASAVVADSAQVDPSASLGPHVVVGEHSVIGPDCRLEACVVVGPYCRIGQGTHLFPNVTIYARTQIGQRVRIHAGTTIGSDGFGYAFDEGVHVKIPQIGNVIIEEDVEIGANAAIDRGALGSTLIGRGAKIDNLVQIAHNVQVGPGCILVGQVGIAGSTRLGSFVTLAGQVGLGDHLNIGDQVTVGAQAGVMHDIPKGETWLGSPAIPNREIKRQWIALKRLPDLIRRVNQLEK